MREIVRPTKSYKGDTPDASIHFHRKVCIIILSLSNSPILTISLKTKLTHHYPRHSAVAMIIKWKSKKIIKPVTSPKVLVALFSSHRTLFIVLWIIACASIFIWQRNIFDGFFVFSHGVNQGKPMPGWDLWCLISWISEVWVTGSLWTQRPLRFFFLELCLDWRRVHHVCLFFYFILFYFFKSHERCKQANEQ